jgi:DNA-binding transcriptional MerR regulator
MKIGELAKRTGLAASTIGRLSNGYREYPPDAQAVLAVIINAQQTGFTLDEIAKILPANAANWQHGELVATLQRKIEDIEAMQVRLAQNKEQLRALIEMIDAKPEGMACQDNASRVMDSVVIQIDKTA